MALTYNLIIVYYYGTVKTFKEEFFMFCDRLNETRKSKGFTAQQMADKLQTGIRNYRKYESGNARPTIDTLVTIADILDVSTDYLLCRDDFIRSHEETVGK